MMSYAVRIPVLTGSADSPVDLNETAVRLVLLYPIANCHQIHHRSIVLGGRQCGFEYVVGYVSMY